MSSRPDSEAEAPFSRGELRDAALTGVRWIAFARVTAETVALACGVLLAHLIPPFEFGRLAVALLVRELALAIANEGIASRLVRRSTATHADLQSAALLAGLVGVTLTLAFLFPIPILAASLFGSDTAELFRLFAPTFMLVAIGIVPLARLQRRLDFRRISLIEVASTLVTALGSVALAVAGLDAEAYVLATLAGVSVWAVALCVVGGGVRPGWHPEELRGAVSFGLPAALAGLAAVGNRNADYVVLGARLSPTQVGYYYRGYSLGVGYQDKVSGIVGRLLLPVYSRTQDLAHLRAVRTRVVRATALLIYPLLAFIAATAPVLVPGVFGNQWHPSVVATQILCVAGAAVMINNGIGPVMLAAGRPRALLGMQVAQLGALVLAVALTAVHGLTIVCLAVASVHVSVVVISHARLLKPAIGVGPGRLARDLAPALAGSAVLLAIAWTVTAGLRDATPALITLAAAGAAGGLAYLAVLRSAFPAAWADLTMLTGKLVGVRRPRLLRRLRVAELQPTD